MKIFKFKIFIFDTTSAYLQYMLPNHISYSLSWLLHTTRNFAWNFKSGWTEWRSSCDAVLWQLLYPQQLFLKLHS